MLADYLKALTQAYTAPQASARTILSTGAGYGGAFLMLLLGYLLTDIVMILTPGIERPADIGVVDRQFFGVVSTLISFFVVSTLIYFFGRVSGGRGSREDTYVIVAWHSVVTAILSAPVNLMISGFRFEERNGIQTLVETPGTLTIGLAVAAVALWCWLLAHFVTVLHGFRNFWGVAAVIMGIPVGLGFLMVNVVGMLSALSTQGVPQ